MFSDLLDLYRDLDRYPNKGIESYGISMTTLNEVFLKLEGKSTMDESGKKYGWKEKNQESMKQEDEREGEGERQES